jgi:hypothetical protein
MKRIYKGNDRELLRNKDARETTVWRNITKEKLQRNEEENI